MAKQTTEYVTIVSHKKKWVAFILCLIGGLFGLHHFYVGRIFRGIVDIFTFNFFLVGYIIDLIAILCGSFTDRAGLPLKA